MRNHPTHRLGVSLLGVFCLVALASCGDHDSDRLDRSNTTFTTSPITEIADLPASDLIGMSGNEMLDRVFIDKYRNTQVGDGRVRDFGGIKFSTERLNLVKSLVPDKADQYEMYTGEYRVVTACVTQNKSDNSFGLYLGTLPQKFASDSLIEAGRAGDHRDIMDRNTPCHSWGPPLPLSQMH